MENTHLHMCSQGKHSMLLVYPILNGQTTSVICTSFVGTTGEGDIKPPVS